MPPTRWRALRRHLARWLRCTARHGTADTEYLCASRPNNMSMADWAAMEPVFRLGTGDSVAKGFNGSRSAGKGETLCMRSGEVDVHARVGASIFDTRIAMFVLVRLSWIYQIGMLTADLSRERATP